MENLAFMQSRDTDATVALAITRFYMDYNHTDIRPVLVPDPSSPPWDEVTAEGRIFLLGLTPAPDVFARLYTTAGDLVWIENDMEQVDRITAGSTRIANYARIKGKRVGGLSLCELTWDSYFAWAKKRPEVVDLIGRFVMNDRMDSRWQTRIVPFNTALATKELDPHDDSVFQDFWKKVLCLRRDPDYEREVVEAMIALGSTGERGEGA